MSTQLWALLASYLVVCALGFLVGYRAGWLDGKARGGLDERYDRIMRRDRVAIPDAEQREEQAFYDDPSKDTP